MMIKETEMDTVFALINLSAPGGEDAIVGIFSTPRAAEIARAIEALRNPEIQYMIKEYPLD
jgi:hypothetical protein